MNRVDKGQNNLLYELFFPVMWLLVLAPESWVTISTYGVLTSEEECEYMERLFF